MSATNNIDEIWASMNENQTKYLMNGKKSSSKSNLKKEKENPAIVKKTKINIKTNEEVPVPTVSSAHIVSYADLKLKLARDLNSIGDENSTLRKKSLQKIFNVLFVENTMLDDDYDNSFMDISKSILKRFIDPVEKCRELAHIICQQFFDRCQNLVHVLGYYFPALMQRVPSGIGYDDDMKVFVMDMDAHDAYKRGRAIDRQDKGGSAGILTHQVIEVSEEIRLQSCKALNSLIKRVIHLKSTPILHPYFQEMVIYLQTQLRDPYPDLKIIACEALETLAKVQDFEMGMKFFSVGLVRSILPVLRHRQAKVRVAAVTAVHHCMVVQDRAKRKAAGSEAITELVGFREENVLQVAAFYKADVQINHLAELVIDKSVQVRENLVHFLTILLTEIGDRYDHQTRILPYLLDLLTDEAESVSGQAIACLVTCGKQYEEEHQDEIIERRQYGVDGDDRINLDKPLPLPFVERPRIGMRLYVRGNTKRFLHALVNELTNWVSTTRLKSAALLKVVVVLCEEHLTMEANLLFPAFLKALRFARDDKDELLQRALLDVFELLGRYIVPEVSVYYILPRLRGDKDVVQFGVDSETRIVVMLFLQALLEGAKPQLVAPLFEELLGALTDPFIISPDSPNLQNAAMDTMCTIFQAAKGREQAVVEAHFVATGRLTSLQKTLRNTFRFLLINLSKHELNDRACRCLQFLSQLQSDPTPGVGRFEFLVFQHALPLLHSVLDDSEPDLSDPDWSPTSPEHFLLCRLIEAPGSPVQAEKSGNAISKVLNHLCNSVSSSRRATNNLHTEQENTMLLEYSNLLQATLIPLFFSQFPVLRANLYKPLLSSITAWQQHQGTTIQHGLPTGGQQQPSIAVNIVREQFLLAIIDNFVLDSRWSRNAPLQSARIDVLCVLGVFPHPLSNRWPMIRPADVEPVLFFDKPFSSPVLTAVSNSAVLPSNPLSLRLGFVAFGTQLLSRLSGEGSWKLQSFKKRLSLSEEAIWRDGPKKKVAAVLLRSFLGLLSDSSDEVRSAVLDSLSKSVVLLSSSEDRAILLSSNAVIRGMQVDSAHEGDVVLWEDALIVLLRELRSSIISEDAGVTLDNDKDNGSVTIVDKLDNILRVLAVLDPVAFEAQIRFEIAEQNHDLGASDKRKSDRYMCSLSELISHADLLAKFETS